MKQFTSHTLLRIRQSEERRKMTCLRNLPVESTKESWQVMLLVWWKGEEDNLRTCIKMLTDKNNGEKLKKRKKKRNTWLEPYAFLSYYHSSIYLARFVSFISLTAFSKNSSSCSVIQLKAELGVVALQSLEAWLCLSLCPSRHTEVL